MTTRQILAEIEGQGVRLWEEGGAIRYTAPRGVMSKALLQQLSSSKVEVLTLLRERKESDAPGAAIRLRPDQAHAPFPLNDLQAAYLVGRDEVFEIGNIASHAYFELRKENVDLDRLKEAWRAVIARHPMLRTVILPGGMQKVLEQTPEYAIEVLDLRNASPGEREKQLERIRSAMSHHIFVPEIWPAFELRVSLLPAGTVLLHMGIDQLIADGLSIYLIFRDFHVFYEGRGDSLPVLELSFRDYLLAERDLERSPLYQKSQAYWEQRIPTLPDAPQLPFARNIAGITRPQFSHRRFCLDKNAWTKLKEKAAGLGLSPSCVVLAAYADILAAWSAEQTFTINMTMFNRLPLHPQVMEVVGAFTSLNLLEVDNRGRSSFIQRTRQIQSRLWDDMDHRYFNGVKVLRELGKYRRSGASALAPVVFTSTIGLTPDEDGESISLNRFGEVLYNIIETPQVWLDIQIFEQNGMLVCNWDAVEELFPQAVLDDMFSAFASLLHRLAQNAPAWSEETGTPLPEAQAAERAVFNNTAAPESDLLLHQLFALAADRFPDKQAVIAGNKSVTFAELRDAALRLAQALRAQGAGKNTLVAVTLEKGWEQVAAVLGIQYAGAAYMPVDPALPDARRRELLLEGGVSLAVTLNKEAHGFDWPKGVNPLAFDSLDAPVSSKPQPVFGKPGDLAYVIFTSGSTGRPKGVMIDHSGAVNTVLDITERFDITEGDAVLGISSLSFDLSVYDIFGILGAGGTLVLPDADKTKEPGHWLQLMQKHGVTCWNTVPALLQMLVEECRSVGASLPALRLVMLSGDWIPLSLPGDLRLIAPEARVISLGGATEASIWSVLYPIERVDPEWKSIPYGYPMKNQSLHVLNSAMAPCPDFVAGDLYIGGKGLALGYRDDEEKSRASFISHPDTGERLYRTGDLARHLPGGVLEFLGRRDYQVKIGGFRIELGEIETVLKKHEEVREAIVTVSQDGPHGVRSLHAYVVPSENAGDILTAPAEEGDGDEQTIRWRPLLLNSREAARKLPDGVTDIQAFSDFWSSLDELCIAYMCRALRELGAFTARQTLTTDEVMELGGVGPKHRKLLIRWLNALSREGLLEKKAKDLYRSPCPLPEAGPDSLWQRVRSLSHSIGNKHELLTFMELSCTRLVQLFRQEISLQELLFPEGKWDVAEDVYQYNPMGRYYYSILSAAFACIVKDRDSGKPLRVLEVGAGVGSSSALTLPLADPSRTRYVYTDISPFFLEKARDKFDDYPFIEYGIYDINIEPMRQGYEENSFDVIIANNVMHNAGNLQRTMRWLNSLLDQSGCVLILEQTGINYPLLVTMEFLIDFSELEDERVEQDSPFLSRQAWENTLAKSGFLKTAVFPVPGHPCGALSQHIFIAQNARSVRYPNEPVLRDYLAQRLPAYMVPGKFHLLESLPLTPTGKVDRNALNPVKSERTESRKACIAPSGPHEEKMAALWSEVLGVEKISAEDNFFDIGGDSLLLTRLQARMREELGGEAHFEELTLRNLIEQPTMAGMASTLRDLVEARTSADAAFRAETPLVALKKEGSNEPFFLISDGRGRLFVYTHLRKYFSCDRPLYGLQVHDINGYVASGASIETLAENYIQAVRQVQPEGPYHLGGFCMGGIIAYEMARQLAGRGQGIGRVVLISSVKPPFLLDDDIFIFHMLCKELMIPLENAGLDISGEEFNSIAAQLSEWDESHLRQVDWKKQMRGDLSESFLSKYEVLAQLDAPGRIQFAYDLAAAANNPYITRMSPEELAGIFAIYRASVISVARYKPGRYDGPVTVFAPVEQDPFMSKSMDIVDIRNESASANVTFIDVEGSHATCLEEPHVRKLAAKLNSLLRSR